MKRSCEGQADVLDPRSGLLSGDSIDSVGESRLYELWMVGFLRGLFFANYRCDSKESERQWKEYKAAEAGRHGDSVVDHVAVRQIFFVMEKAAKRRDEPGSRDIVSSIIPASKSRNPSLLFHIT
jgi:hypothetical protein